jgi:hypothetical protein
MEDDNGRLTIREQQADHEQRIRSLEKWRYAIPASLIIALAAGIGFILKAL